VSTAQTNKPETPEQVLDLASAWYRQQVSRLSQCLGPSWPEHQQWIESFLAEEVRQKLIARGWRPKS
jgi:hypothetical protein